MKGLFLIFFLAGCVPNMLSRPVMIRESARPALSEATAVLSKFDFRVINDGETRQANVLALRESVKNAIKSSGVFRDTLDGESLKGMPEGEVVYFEVVAEPAVKSEFNWYWAWPAAYPCIGYWPAQPKKGVSSVSLRVEAFSENRRLKLWELEESRGFSMDMYGFFRT